MNGGIRVKYSDYEAIAKYYKSELKSFDVFIETYSAYLDMICKKAIMSGQVNDALVEFNKKFSKVKKKPSTIGKKVSVVINDYLDDLDKAQKINGESILYDRKYPERRDYTVAYFNKLERLVEDADYNSGFLNKFADAVEDTYYKVRKFFGAYNNAKSKDLKKTHEALLQYNDVTRRQLMNIKRRVGDADERCANRLKLIEDAIFDMLEYICIFRDLMAQYQDSPSDLNLSGVDFKTKYNKMIRSYNEVVIMDTITDEDVENFINSEGADRLMDEQVDVIYDYIADLSSIEITDGDFWKIIIYQMFDIAETELANVDGTQCYEDLIRKKELTDLFDELADEYVYSGSDEQEALDTVRSILKEAKSRGKNLYEFLNSLRNKEGKLVLDGRTKKAKEFLRFLDKLGDITDILKYGDQAIEIFSKMFIDYDKNMQFLESMERNVHLSDEMKACFDELRSTYEHELSSAFLELERTIAKDGVDALYSISIGKIVGTVKMAIGVIGDATGDSAKTAAQLEVIIYGNDVVSSSRNAFRESMKKLKAAEKTDENYELLLNDFKNCFSIYKTSLKRLFEKMAVAADSPKKDYFYYCSSEVSKMSLKDFSNNNIMSYDEYLKVGYAY